MWKNINSLLSIRRAHKNLRKNNLSKSIEILQQATRKDSSNPHLYLHLAVALAKNDGLEEAQNALKKAMELSPVQPIYSLFMGKILLDFRKYEEAEKYLTISLKFDSLNQVTWGYLALANLGMGKIDRFKNIIEEKGISENSHLQIGIILHLEQITRGWQSDNGV